MLSGNKAFAQSLPDRACPLLRPPGDEHFLAINGHRDIYIGAEDAPKNRVALRKGPVGIFTDQVTGAGVKATQVLYLKPGRGD
ncbi:MAG: hypothetical protein U9R22_05865 [Pseudomonadota bacterium]|nr:hypothetical protein [Pseudomonadota bacterium]